MSDDAPTFLFLLPCVVTPSQAKGRPKGRRGSCYDLLFLAAKQSLLNDTSNKLAADHIIIIKKYGGINDGAINRFPFK
jgi:hypothetical protein